MNQNKLSYYTVLHLIEALKIEHTRLIKARDSFNMEEISIRLEDIKKDVEILTELINEYEKGKQQNERK